MWWLTIPKWRTTCQECAAEVEDAPIYFWSAKNPDERRILCGACGEAQNIAAEPSKRYRKWREPHELTL